MTKKILIRIDDVCPTMNWEQFEKAIKLMDALNIKPLIGVIPDCKDSDLMICDARNDFWNYIKDLQQRGYTIAMHGLYHTFNSHYRGNIVSRHDSEFAGLSLDTQVHMIQTGKEILNKHGINTQIFFAPGHSYDDNTIKALSICGFKYLSDGKSYKAYKKEGIKLLPCRTGGVPRLYYGKYHTAVFHTHEWAWNNKAYCYKQFKDLLYTQASNIVDFDTFCQQPEGCLFAQEANERLYIFIERHVRPVLATIKHLI